MSWSITVIGKPGPVSAELEKYSATLNGQSKVEYDEAKPHLQSLIKLNVGGDTLVKITASGHATINGELGKTYGNCQVVIEPFYAKLALGDS